MGGVELKELVAEEGGRIREKVEESSSIRNVGYGEEFTYQKFGLVDAVAYGVCMYLLHLVHDERMKLSTLTRSVKSF